MPTPDYANAPLERAFEALSETALTIKAERDRFEGALRRIVKDAPLIEADKMYEIARKALKP